MPKMHTPGPWTFDAQSAWVPWSGSIEILGADGQTIAWTTSGGNEGSDAPILAAAPDMLAALESIKWKSADRDNMEFSARITCFQMDAIRAALAAASPADTE